MDSNDGNNAKKIIAAFVVILAIVLVTVGVNASNKKRQSSDNATTNTKSSTSTATPEASAAIQAPEATTTDSTPKNLKDGTYTAKSEYSVPSGYEDISVTLTIKDGIATASQVSHSENDRESAHYQERFSTSYKTYVVGKKVNGLKIPYVAGASDTAEGFNEALEKIIAQAHV